ncbi:MAG: polyprenyl synthetase family protein [Bacteroidales bacterium]|nr:polyprenyl synthetase family protein [Bacteroidales bacterium]MCF8403167.1 polyprenyl synthetase family protein [Bacteroidales bacterium]
MLPLTELTKLINSRIEQLDFKKPPVELYDPIQYTLNLGGKRLRPALCLLACDLVGGNVKDALDPAIGIEIFHNFTLLHDDIMDGAPIRRGKPTVYKKWNTNVAILSGDTMMALSYEHIMKAPENLRSKIFLIFNETAIEVCEGQQYDMNFEISANVSIDDYLEMIRLKTAVLLAASLKIGVIIGGADDKVARLIYDFGENIGIAFQLMDDLLDVYSKQEKFGKTTGGDILANKKTYLYLKAFEIAEGEELDQLQTAFNEEAIRPQEKVISVKTLYDKLGIKTLTEEKMDHYYNKAMESLSQIALHPEKKKTLIDFARKLRSRDY